MTRPTGWWIAAALMVGTGAREAAGQPIFADGFESGGLCPWSGVGGETTGCCGGLVYTEGFGADGAAWPAPWSESGSVALADVVGGRARFRPTASGYSLARLIAPVDTHDVEVRFTVVFEDIGTQGVGFYVRQNGGYLDQTVPAGQGYAIFVEGFRGVPGIGVWKEVAGHEIDLAITFDPALGLQSHIPYRVRFRVNQVDTTSTLLQGKVWPVGDPEPGWQVSFLDSTPELQGISGGIALDSWSSIQAPNPITAHTSIDDIEVEVLCNPLADLGAVEPVGLGFEFAEGPVWRDDHLLFSDITGDAIHRHEPPSGFSVHRSPSGRANGLATAIDGALLVAEHQGRRISREDPDTGTVSELVGMWNGLRFSSPNDLVMRSDGTLYFTDPDYGLADPADREIPFNGLYRLPPGGSPVAEWAGGVGVNQPNGVALSPDESTLYLTDTHQGSLIAFDVAPDGSLSGARLLRSGLTIPDGMCVDNLGTVFVATWAPSLEVFTADGTRWGSIPLPQNGTNCAFGGPTMRTVFVTAGTGLYALERQ